MALDSEACVVFLKYSIVVGIVAKSRLLAEIVHLPQSLVTNGEVAYHQYIKTKGMIRSPFSLLLLLLVRF